MSEEQTKQNVSLEETFEQIETIIKQLESPEVTLKMQVMQTDGSLADFE